MLLFKTLALAAVMAFTAGEALAKKNCWCHWKAGSKNGTEIHGYGSLKEWSDITIKEGGMLVEKWCANECSKKASPDIGKQFLADSACSKGVANGTIVAAFSKVGANGNNDMDAANKPLINTAAVYKCEGPGHVLTGSNCKHVVAISKKCPAGWAANQTNQDGGETADGLCKKAVQGCVLPPPLPANGTQIGTSGYGFTWGNAVVVFGNAGNGGAAIISCPAGYSISGISCVKAYAATLVSPKVCKFQP